MESCSDRSTLVAVPIAALICRSDGKPHYWLHNHQVNTSTSEGRIAIWPMFVAEYFPQFWGNWMWLSLQSVKIHSRNKSRVEFQSLTDHCTVDLVRVYTGVEAFQACLKQAPDSETSLMPVSSVPHVSDRLELHNNNWASGSQHPGPSESDIFSDVVQEARSNDLLHTARLSVRLDTPLHGNDAIGAKYAVFYASVVTHTVFENIKWLHSVLCWHRNLVVPSLASLFPA